MVSSRNNSSSNSGSSLNLNSFDFSRGGSNNMVGNWGSKTVLIDIFRESFQRKGSIAAVGSNKVTN